MKEKVVRMKNKPEKTKQTVEICQMWVAIVPIILSNTTKRTLTSVSN